MIFLQTLFLELWSKSPIILWLFLGTLSFVEGYLEGTKFSLSSGCFWHSMPLGGSSFPSPLFFWLELALVVEGQLCAVVHHIFFVFCIWFVLFLHAHPIPGKSREPNDSILSVWRRISSFCSQSCWTHFVKHGGNLHVYFPFSSWDDRAKYDHCDWNTFFSELDKLSWAPTKVGFKAKENMQLQASILASTSLCFKFGTLQRSQQRSRTKLERYGKRAHC